MVLLELANTLARAEDPTEGLRLIDAYAKSSLPLPPEHVYLAPAVKKYGSRLDQFRLFARAVRDEVGYMRGVQSGSYDDAQAFVRTLDVRYAQQKRRQRIQAAYSKMKELDPELATEQRLRWMRRLEQSWSSERLQWLKDARKSKRGNRLSEEERGAVLEQFWAELDDRIAAGAFPTLAQLEGESSL